MNLTKMTRKRKVLATSVLLLPAVAHIFPALYMLSISLKTGPEIFQYPPTLLPNSFDVRNYIEAFQAAPLTRFLINSLIVSIAITVLQVVTSILAAFAVARIEFYGKRFFLILILATMMIPGEIAIVPNYMTISALGWLNTYYGLVGPFAASGFGFFLLYQFFRTIPKELEEAAIVDGASKLRFLFQFVVPLSMPAIFAFSVYAFVSAWNQYLWPLVVTQSTEMRTVQIGIGMFRSENESSSWGVIMAATTVLILPSIMIFIATQKQFVRGITMSGMKG